MQADVIDENKCLVSAVDYYFIEEDGGRFKATLPFPPYFYVLTKKDTERDVSSFLSRKLSGRITGIDLVDKEDMDLVSEVLLPLVELHLSLHSLLLSLTSLSHLSLSIHFFSLSPLSTPPKCSQTIWLD